MSSLQAVISALDTNVLLDVLMPGAADASGSRERLDAAAVAGALVVSEAVYAELAAAFPGRAELDVFLSATGIVQTPSGTAALWRAGEAWRLYSTRRPRGLVCPYCDAANSLSCAQCRREVTSRQHVVADFLIGAHALVHADGLLTRDRGFYRTYFPTLRLV
jgi:hypothetical protein